ncbi:flavin-nucleotide-binding protein [Haladaptatus sp. R4]|uniref:pyridoxamine 5'-phosphate oxidase family protein n=1 Tax=Haladaptatus sp. R4 TaxID=1679489 RepID=UPI0007B4E81E|nr:pyridoxamine 5'-phosphate oxidase family protein [Haladaptatus sp. R4]KZN25785.1 flavin-nucleotide-binding protein [Haladaptatus sp. R4]
MGDIESVRMDDEERDEFLTSGGTGVISFPIGIDESPYSVPVSYGYDPTDVHFYFRLAVEQGGERDEVIDRPVTFVTYDHTDDGWRSVVVRGELDEVAEADITSEVVQGVQRVDIPLVDLFERDSREVTFEFFHLHPTEITSRKEALTEG